MKHRLVNSKTQKEWLIELNGNEVNAPRISKSFPNREEALEFFEKKEWEKIKKGFVVENPEAKKGDVIFHRREGTQYTGTAGLTAGDSKVFYTQFQDSSDSDNIYLIDLGGKVLEHIALPQNGLVFKAQFYKGATYFLNIDHQVYEFNSMKKTFEPLSDIPEKPLSVLSLSENLLCFNRNEEVIVKDLSSEKELFRQELQSELYEGHSTQFAGAVCSKAMKLITCSNNEEIIIWDLKTGEKNLSIPGPFKLVKDIQINSEGSHFFIQEIYNQSKIRCFEVSSGKENLKNCHNEVRAYSVHPNQNALSYFSYGKIHVVEIPSGNEILSFSPLHVVKSLSLHFFDSFLALKSDYGCMSLYKIS